MVLIIVLFFLPFPSGVNVYVSHHFFETKIDKVLKKVLDIKVLDKSIVFREG